MVKNIKFQMKVHFFGLQDLISIIRFLATFQLPCSSSIIHEGAAMWLLPSIFKNALVTTLTSRASATAHIDVVVTTVYTTEPLIQKKHLWS